MQAQKVKIFTRNYLNCNQFTISEGFKARQNIVLHFMIKPCKRNIDVNNYLPTLHPALIYINIFQDALEEEVRVLIHAKRSNT